MARTSRFLVFMTDMTEEEGSWISREKVKQTRFRPRFITRANYTTKRIQFRATIMQSDREFSTEIRKRGISSYGVHV